MKVYAGISTILAVLLSTFVVTGCSRMTPEEAWTKASEAEQAARRSLDTARTAVDKKKVFAPVIEAYGKLIDDYADSPQAEEALVRRAAILGNDTRDIEPAIEDYKLYAKRYPESARTPLAMFMVGYMYNNELGKTDSAAAAYKRFLEKYPDNEMAPSAQFELNTLGKAPEELLPPGEPAEESPAKASKPTAAAKK